MATATATVAPTLYHLTEVRADVRVLAPGRYVIHHPGGHALDVRLLEPAPIQTLADAIQSLVHAA